MLLSLCNSSKWHNSKQCGSKEKIPRVQIRVKYQNLFIYSFIHSIQKKQTNKQASRYSKQIQQAITGRPIDRYRYRRPSTTHDRPTAVDDDARPTDGARPTDDRRRRRTTDRRPSTTTHDHLLRRLLFVFLHFDGRLSICDDRRSKIALSFLSTLALIKQTYKHR